MPADNLLVRTIPFLQWIADYRKAWFRPDSVAGLTTAAVVIPKSMAYATIAGLPVVVGLYTAFLPMLIYAFLGSSRPLSVSTDDRRLPSSSVLNSDNSIRLPTRLCC